MTLAMANKPNNNAKKIEQESGVKKKFDKKKWREDKYSIKAKVKRWDEHRRKILTKQYEKELKKSGMSGEGKAGRRSGGGGGAPKSEMKKALLVYDRKQEEKRRKLEERERAARERKEALKAYREKKAEKFRKLSQRTRKGQPVMRGRLELLLEKIEKSYANRGS